MGDYVLEMKHIHKNYGGIQALKDVSFSLKKGEVLCLCGENGAGKSTLMKILVGVERATRGEIFLNGRSVDITKPIDAYNLGISIVHQELVQIPDMTVAENIFVGRYEKKFGFIDKKALREKTIALMKRLDVYFDPDSLLRQYSVAQRQLIEIMKALSYDSSIIIFDEPTAALTLEETEILYKIVERLAKEGVSIVFISHRMEDIFRIGDRVYVLKDGAHSGTVNVNEVTENDVIRLMIGRDIGDQFMEKTNVPADVVLEVRGLTNKFIRDVSFQVRAGEIVGLGGLIGAGRTELLQTIYGINDYEGEIIYNGQIIKNNSPKQAISRGFSLVQEDRKDTGLILNHSIRENILMPILDSVSKYGFVRKKPERQIPNEYIKRLNIRTPGASLKTGMLSGGNQQKVVIAKCLVSEPKVILLDEPTRGVDVGAKAEIYRIINGLASDGYAIIMVSSELPELIAVSDRIIVMHEGRVRGHLRSDEATEESIMKLAI